MRKFLVPGIAIAIGIAGALAAFNLLGRLESTQMGANENFVQIGEIQNVQGQVERRLPKSVSMETVPSPRPFYNQDLIVTHENASADIALADSGATIRVNASSRFVAEIDATQPDRVNGTILDGTVNVLTAGTEGRFRLFRNGQQIAFSDAAKAEAPVLNPNEAPAEQNVAPEFSVTPTLPDEAATPAPSVAEQEDEEPSSDVLTNDQILKQLRTQMSFFQRCYLNFIHRSRQANPNAEPKSGVVTVSFEVETNGKVKETKLVRSDFDDGVLHSCLLEVVGRTRFKGFKGKAVPVHEFPIRLQ